MATITGTDIIERVTDTLQDKDNIRWPREELLRYINDAQREVVLQRPDSSARTETVQLTPSNTKQEIPASGVRLIEVVRNMGGGDTPGRSIRLTAREVLDAQIMNWHATTPQAAISHFMFDIRNPRVYYVYPRPSAGVSVEIVYSAAPVDLTSEASVIGVDDIYANAIIAFVLMRAYQKDEDYARNLDVAIAWYQVFNQSLGLRTQSDVAMNPNANLGTDKSR